MNVSKVLHHLKQLSRLYGTLLDEENRRLSLYLAGDLEEVEAGHIREEYSVDEVRRIHSMLQSEFSEDSLEGISRELSEAECREVETSLADLDRSMQELKIAIRRNRRYVQNSLAYSQAVVQRMFAEHSSYDGDGFVKTGGRSLRGGMRV